MTSLFTPIELRSVRLSNRIVVSPMCQYSAVDGMLTDWHIVHLGRFALGGAGAVITEATGISPDGRISTGCAGLWDDRQIAPFARVVSFLKEYGAVAGIQLAHSGRKGSAHVSWEGGAPLQPSDPGYWETIAPSPIPFGDKHPVPREMNEADMGRIRDQWRAAIRRAAAAGFDLLELHGGHGYLMHQFLSPLSNHRQDRYGGSLENRMRFPLELVGMARETWPAEKPLFVRISSTDRLENGWQIEDSIAYVREMKALGVDVVDCSSGGSSPAGRGKVGPGYQIEYSDRIRKDVGIKTMAVGLITTAELAESVIAEGRADLVAIGREALSNPNWPRQVAAKLGAETEDFATWPKQARGALAARSRALRG